MSADLAFVGDIHGNIAALQGLWRELDRRETPGVIFLGDYINKGPSSADVLELLLAQAEAGRAILLAGNHETALLDALDRGDLSAFLKLGGAMTIRSYVGEPVGPDVLKEFAIKFPREHEAAIRRMPASFESGDVFAQHVPPSSPTEKYQISAHVPVGERPRVLRRSAQLDTGCGTASGRLTALMWPTLGYIQVDNSGNLVTD